MSARFAFESPSFRVEFRGSESFVREQLETVRERILAILGGRTSRGAATPERAGEAGLEEYFRAARTREGRGALQDSILIFASYLGEQQGKREFSIEDLNFCFDLLGHPRPKSLANTLGILKRDRKLLHSGSRRGTYALSEKGTERVRRLVD